MSRTCPCCGKEIPRGLFSQALMVELPTQLQVLLDKGQIEEPDEHSGELVEFYGRFFLQVRTSLPISQQDSPVIAVLWLEIDLPTAESIQSARDEHEHVWGEGHLAGDIPGFLGTFGAKCEFHLDPARPRATLTMCYDARVAALPIQATHQELVRLYRLMWGNTRPLVESDARIRASALEHWHKLIKRPFFRREIEPPPALSGFKPPEVIVSPPIDTGGEAVLATVGCSEVPHASGARAEIITWAKDPSEEFITCFAEFCFLSRGNDSPLVGGTIVPEPKTIPDSEGGMAGWLLCEPWWLKEDLKSFPTYAGEVQALAALGLHKVEMAIAQMAGVDVLQNMIIESSVDLTDLTREPVLSHLDP